MTPAPSETLVLNLLYLMVYGANRAELQRVVGSMILVGMVSEMFYGEASGMSDFQAWRSEFLAARGLSRADGRMLFSYRTTREEYLELRALFAGRIQALGDCAWTLYSTAECACFVLYAAEWWRREYAGGYWRWQDILASFKQSLAGLDITERSSSVESGLFAWGHRPGVRGKKYLGAIVAQGGLPMQLVAQGDGAITRLLIRGMHLARQFDWNLARLEDFFSAHADELVNHLRIPEIYTLLATVVIEVRNLARQCGLVGAQSPAQVLNAKIPTWRDRLPFAVDDPAAAPLLANLVNEAAIDRTSAGGLLIVAERRLYQEPDRETYTLGLSARTPRSVGVRALTEFFQIDDETLPPTFALDLVGQDRRRMGEGRQLLSETALQVLLNCGELTLRDEAAAAGQVIVLRAQGVDLGQPAEVPGAQGLDADLPWVFSVRPEGNVLVASGSCRMPESRALVVTSYDANVSAEGTGSLVTLVAFTRGLAEARCIHEVAGAARITAAGGTYVVRTSVPREEGGLLVWRGRRLPNCTSPVPIFLGVPELCLVEPDGHWSCTPSSALEWRTATTHAERVEKIRRHIGPIDAWLTDNGIRRQRFRMLLLPKDASLHFHAGASDREASITFEGWQLAHVDVPANLLAGEFRGEDTLRVDLRSAGRPPAVLRIALTWHGCGRAMSVDLPFPVTGGRFVWTDGSPVDVRQAVALRQLNELRLEVFDQHPERQRRWTLSAEIGGRVMLAGTKPLLIEHAIPIYPRGSGKAGFGELRLFEVADSLIGLFSQANQLDARLELTLLAGGAVISRLHLIRYDTGLLLESTRLSLPDVVRMTLTPAHLAQVRLAAIPLLRADVDAVDLEQVTVDGAASGQWDLSGLDAQRGLWLVYPRAGSSLQARPMLFQPVLLPLLPDAQKGRCALTVAMAGKDPEQRASEISVVVREMAADFSHPSWRLITHHWSTIGHLPLSALDYWRAISRSPVACVSALLQLGGVQDLAQRMRNELGVIWELLPLPALKAAREGLRKQLVASCGNVLSSEHLDLTCDVQLQVLAGISETLNLMVTYARFEAGAVLPPQQHALMAQLQRAAVCGVRALLGSIWIGEESLVQRHLLRQQADVHIWPSANTGLAEYLMGCLERAPDSSILQAIVSSGTSLVWRPTAAAARDHYRDHKENAVNAPLLAALGCQIGATRGEWPAFDAMVELRQIRAFDPTWFDLSCIHAFKLTLAAGHAAEQARQRPPAAGLRCMRTGL